MVSDHSPKVLVILRQFGLMDLKYNKSPENELMGRDVGLWDKLTYVAICPSGFAWTLTFANLHRRGRPRPPSGRSCQKHHLRWDARRRTRGKNRKAFCHSNDATSS